MTPSMSVQANTRVVLENQSRMSNLYFSRLLLVFAISVSATNSYHQHFVLEEERAQIFDSCHFLLMIPQTL